MYAWSVESRLNDQRPGPTIGHCRRETVFMCA
jgi:hypothetical protein